MTNEQVMQLTNMSGNSLEETTLHSKVASFRKDALHLFGVDELNTQDIFDYFKEFKAFAVEWINDRWGKELRKKIEKYL